MNYWDRKRRVMHRYNASSRSYDSLYGEEQHAKYEKALRSVTLQSARLALDAGCGSGLLFDRLSPDVETVVGLDISRSLLLLAKAKVKEQANVHLVQADVDNMPFASGVFDAVFVFTVLQNIPKPIETLRGIGQAAKHNATIVVTGLKKHFSFENLKKLLGQAGFSPVSLINDESLNCYVVILMNRR